MKTTPVTNSTLYLSFGFLWGSVVSYLTAIIKHAFGYEISTVAWTVPVVLSWIGFVVLLRGVMKKGA